MSERLSRTRGLSRPVSRLRYATGARGQALERLGCRMVLDLFLRVPRRYLDFTHVVPIAHADVGSEATIVGRVDKVTLKRPRPRMQIVEVAVVDATGVLMAAFFKQPWLAEQLRVGDQIALSGKVTFAYGFKQMTPQFHEVIASAASRTESGAADAVSGAPSVAFGSAAPLRPDSAVAGSYARVLPVHPVGEGVSPAWMRRIVSAALADVGDVCDFMPARLIASRRLMTLARALREVHFPRVLATAELARRRLSYDELLCLQVALLARQRIALDGVAPHAHVIDGPHVQAVLRALPFELTEEQRAAADDILRDMGAPRPMNRLLLGDVGTGKTAVAAVAVAAVADSGTQAAVMAPTSVLARQYAEKLGPVFDKAGVRWALVTGSTPSSERSSTAQALSRGELDVLFGTTAVLGEDLSFPDLSLVVVDEQHRFGVGQRTALRTKGRAADQLTMTATPIPRTLALSVYGDLACSRIRTRPRAGAGIETRVITPENVDLAYTAVAEAVAAGHQAYVVCPLVDDADEGEELDDLSPQRIEGDSGEGHRGVKPAASQPHSATATFERLRDRVFRDLSVGLVTGRMGAVEKDEAMAAFRSGETQVLVSTTVIEVGVDVPNATVMVVWDADRFGLAALHQLRGRVGRGDVPGTVFLVSSARGTSPARRRLRALERTSDGFELAELDLSLRHEGEVLGYRQSGGVTLRLVDLAADGDLVEAAHEDARRLVDEDPSLAEAANGPLAHEVRRRFGTYFEGERSR